ncbi:DUF1579 family protein [Stigmatella aurantiaca]|uniref:Lipoprotein n=1 Tax=Stigmatella aurantiaca (strain DW4/3-1) TaxID=378806 RepID=Q095P5_STIAD|nr:DUF1579 family protein [Stigmatella aurantiaca]ADO68351.1 uncharacterized protein STAUR_0547 [Stigmatella aurantiaca DW4/3-1]EAU67421.1 hypothetical protein STIAU_1657 [Stigmatella aurantiaca DW4/3-1]
MNLKHCLLCALTLSTAACGADEKKDPGVPPPPKPAEELQQLKFFNGTWNCEGKTQDDGSTPGYEFKSTLQVAPYLDNYWIEMKYEEHTSKTNPYGFKSYGRVGWDGTKQKFVRLHTASQGAWETALSPGFVDSKLVWTGDLNNLGNPEPVPFRHTFEKKSDTLLNTSFELQVEGVWKLIQVETCKK